MRSILSSDTCVVLNNLFCALIINLYQRKGIMVYKSRPVTFAFYRLFFVVLLFTLAIFCLGQPAMEYFFGHSMISTISIASHDAILAGLMISGVLAMVYAIILLRIMVDRRTLTSDRRQRQVPINFPDRRSGIDRRTGEPWGGYS